MINKALNRVGFRMMNRWSLTTIVNIHGNSAVFFPDTKAHVQVSRFVV